jgi:hypothetical protein
VKPTPERVSTLVDPLLVQSAMISQRSRFGKQIMMEAEMEMKYTQPEKGDTGTLMSGG